jgi:uncharacterized damage-inducible protein DinB
MDERSRTRPPLAADEAATLIGFLEHHRDTLRWKTEGLDAKQLNRTVGPSTMTLGGLLKHMALVEDWWFSAVLVGARDAPPFRDVDWDADPDWEWHSARDDSPEDLRELFDGFVAQSQRNLAEVLADGGLDRLAVRRSRNGEDLSVRWILVHMIEEYARHNGHADLLRERIDGRVGQ